MKDCTKCGLTQPESEYYKTSNGNLHGSCKTCFKAASKKSAQKLGRRHRKDLELQWHYGITIETYDQMMEEVDGKCRCGATEGRANKKALHVDHDHETGLIRGLLCHSCNRAIGLVDDPTTLRALADYIELANSRALEGNGNYVVRRS